MAHPKPSAKNEKGEYARFEDSLKKVLAVSHAELAARIVAEKQGRQQRTKPTSARASRDKG